MKHILILSLIALSFVATPRVAQSEEVQALQAFLESRDCRPGPVDGEWGRKTASALELFQASSGVKVVRPIEAADLEKLATSDFKCSDITNLNYFVPSDVLRDLSALPTSTRSKLCRATASARTTIDSIIPKTKIKGFNSKMSNPEDVYGFSEFQDFTSAFSEVATDAYVHDNDDAKIQLIEALARWAGLGAYQKTRDCVNGKCPADWRRRDGQGISPGMDHSTTVDFAMALAMAYQTVLADYKPELYSRQHRDIKRWLLSFEKKLLNKSGKKAYFGLRMGHQWSHMLMEMSHGNMRAFKQRLVKLSKTIDRTVLPDGSLKDRTTRGNNAFWYHHASLGELIGSLEMMRANGISINRDLEDRTHKAVAIFLNAADDMSSIVKWAAVSHNNGEDGKKQRFRLNDFLATDWGSSWAYAYIYRYPDHPNTVRLHKILDNLNFLHNRDLGLGVNFGCLYRASDHVFQNIEITGKSVFEQSISTYASTFENVHVWIHNATDKDAKYEDYKIRISTAKFGEFEKKAIRLGVLADYPSVKKDINSIRLMRMYVDTYNFKKVDDKKPDFSECGDMAFNEKYGNVRLHFGAERVLNSCIFAKLHPDDLKLWYSLYDAFDLIIGKVTSAPDGVVEKLVKIYLRKVR